MNRTMLKAILFDFGGTLDCDGIPWKERFYPLYRDAGIDWDLSSFERFFYASDDSLTAEKLDAVGYEATILEQVNRVLRNGDWYDALLARRIADRFYSESLRCLNRNKPLLRRLSERYRLGIVSNFYGNLEFLCAEIGYARFLCGNRFGPGWNNEAERGNFSRRARAVGLRARTGRFVGDNLSAICAELGHWRCRISG